MPLAYEYCTLFLQLLFDMFYFRDLQQYIPYGDCVEIVTLERFIMKANMGKL